MTPHPGRPGLGSTLIDLAIVGLALLIFGALGVLLWVAVRMLAAGARAVAGLLRPRRWPRGRRRYR